MSETYSDINEGGEKILELTFNDVFPSRTPIFASGGFSTLYRYTDNMIVKIYDGNTEEMEALAEREYKIMKMLKGKEYILQIRGIYTENNRMGGIILDYMMNKDLSNYIDNNYKNISLLDRLKWMRQISIGLRNVHEKGIIHCDLRCCNIVLDENLNANICDFHGCLIIGEEYKPNFTIFNYDENALEVVLYKRFSFASDIYSLGLTFLHMFMSIVSFCKKVNCIFRKSNKETFDEKHGNLVKIILKYIKLVPLRDLVLDCVSKESYNRPSIEHIIERLNKMIVYESVKLQLLVK